MLVTRDDRIDTALRGRLEDSVVRRIRGHFIEGLSWVDDRREPDELLDEFLRLRGFPAELLPKHPAELSEQRP